MSNASKHRKKAVEYEQLKQFDRAVSSYVRAIEESENAKEEIDVALFNKVGDLTLRQGRVTEAVTYYERAVEHYASVGLFDNAIALCNKILRNAPGRSNVYFTLGRICGRKGLRSDATRNFLAYATRMQSEGSVDEGMRALAEVADLMPELVEVRKLVEEHAARAGIELPQRRRVTPPRAAAAQSMNAAGQRFGLSKDLIFLDIDYEGPTAARTRTPAPVRAVPQPEIATVDTTVEHRGAEICDDDSIAPSRASANVESVCDGPAADVLHLEDLFIYDPDSAEAAAELTPVDNGSVVDGASILRPFVDPATPLPVLADLETTDLIGTATYSRTGTPALPDLLERAVTPTAKHVVASGELASLSIDELESQRVGDGYQTPSAGTPANEGADDLSQDDDANASCDVGTRTLRGFTAEENLHASPEHATGEMHAIADPLVPNAWSDAERVLAIDLDAMLDDVDDIEAAGTVARIEDIEFEEFAPVNDALAAHRFVRVDETAPTGRPDAFDSDDELPPIIFPMPFEAHPFRESDRAAAAIDEMDTDALFATSSRSPDAYSDDETDVPYGNSFDPAFDASFTDSEELFSESVEGTFEASAVELPYDAAFEASLKPASDLSLDVSFDVRFDVPRTDRMSAPGETTCETPVILPCIVSGDAFDEALIDAEFAASNADSDDDLEGLFTDSDVRTAVAAAEAAAVAGARLAELRSLVESAPADWSLRQRYAEALFEAGDREAGIKTLSDALTGYEGQRLLLEAAGVADALVQVAGDQVLHHQKRVELAIRTGDQNRLREAYLDLADNLVRSGDESRSRAVYARVLEIDPWDERARGALGDAAPPAPVRTVAGSDDGEVDLASWLWDDDDPQSTRLRIREPEASGNEEDDFNSLLRHFKEGVARSLGEDDHDSHYDLGVAYKEMGLLDDAIGEFQMALRSRNNRLASYEALGQCFIEQQNFKVAVTVLSRALHEPAIRDGQQVGVLYLLGYSCEALQRFDEARGYFERVYATDILFRDVAQRLADLDRITR
jgi:tetratricopeptide (TPR) repeat protein